MNTARAELGAVKLEELRFDKRYGRLPPASTLGLRRRRCLIPIMATPDLQGTKAPA